MLLSASIDVLRRIGLALLEPDVSDMPAPNRPAATSGPQFAEWRGLSVEES
ncbi:MAG TPA: hypothetical protein VG345_09560 [Bryobacteraceae bacterium]|jgi:hypothetical protein|nr:hypothetical protein [Bryobacteraceae bacterium]